jgi:hypothetical protein
MKATDGFARSPVNPGAVVNVDHGALEAYKKTKQRHREIEELRTKMEDVDNIKIELVEIKSLLQHLIEKLKT